MNWRRKEGEMEMGERKIWGKIGEGGRPMGE
jgi:hypothetical protein